MDTDIMWCVCTHPVPSIASTAAAAGAAGRGGVVLVVFPPNFGFPGQDARQRFAVLDPRLFKQTFETHHFLLQLRTLLLVQLLVSNTLFVKSVRLYEVFLLIL